MLTLVRNIYCNIEVVQHVTKTSTILNISHKILAFIVCFIPVKTYNILNSLIKDNIIVVWAIGLFHIILGCCNRCI